METNIIPKHLQNVNIYLPFKGSNKSNPVRKDLVDLIIPNAAGPKILNRLIQSLMENMSYTLMNASGHKVGGVRIIIISQGEHGSHDLLTKLQHQFPNTIFPVLKEKNFPPPIPYNDGLEYSGTLNPLSEFIMFLDDDMVMLKPGMIELEKKHLEDYGFDLVATEHCFFGEKSSLGPHGEAKDFGMGSFFFRRKLFQQIGYLDEFFKFHCSDSDYCRRIRGFGKKIGIVPDSEKYMFHQHQQGTHNFFKGNHQSVIDHDWVLFREKWYHDGHENHSMYLDCDRCHEIRLTQFPLGRTRYLND